jgi:hypothetical protein
MATVWLEKVWNISSHDFVLRQNDGTWRPWVRERSKSYAIDEEIPVGAGEVLTCDHFFIPWIDWGRLRVEGPGGGLEFSVGPAGWSSLDNLRGFDDERREVLTVEMGPRGGWWSSSVSLHLVFRNDGMQWSIWSATNVGGDVLAAAGELFRLLAPVLLPILLA